MSDAPAPTSPAERPGYRPGGTTGRGWLPGQSGNPNGPSRRRFNGKTLPEIAREHTEDAIKLLARVVKDSRKPLPLRLDAAGRLLTLGWGRAPTVNANVDIPLERRTDAELLRELQALGLAPPRPVGVAERGSSKPLALVQSVTASSDVPTNHAAKEEARR